MQAKSKKLIFIAVLLTGCIITSLISTNDKAKALPGGSSLLQSAQSAVTSKAAQVKTVRVQVSGAVLEPGIYDVPASCRVEEAIAAAGGLTENADSERVNLVRKVRDGMQIRVPCRRLHGQAERRGKALRQLPVIVQVARRRLVVPEQAQKKIILQCRLCASTAQAPVSCSSCPVSDRRWRSVLWRQETAGVLAAWRICCVCRESVKLSWQSCVIMWR